MANRSPVHTAPLQRYTARVNAVMDHVRSNLAEDLSLAELAAVAHFSPYHFHRIFKAVTGETVAEFTRRARLERAVALMRAAPDRELGSVGVEVGFATPSDFSRLFRTRFGIAPSRWDRRSLLHPASTGHLPDASGSPPAAESDPEKTWQPMVVDRSAAVAAYVRVNNPWRGTGLAAGFDLLTGWLTEQGVNVAPERMVGLSWESDKATPIDRVVYDLAITVPPAFEESARYRSGIDCSEAAGVGFHHLSGGLAVEVHCENLRRTAQAWDYLYGEWLPKSNYEPAERPSAKWFRTIPERFDAHAWNVDCSVPLRTGWC